MTSRLGASLAEAERRLRSYKRLIYTLLLLFAALDVFLARLFAEGEAQVLARTLTIGLLLVAAVVTGWRKDALRLVEVGFVVVGGIVVNVLLVIDLTGPEQRHAEAIGAYDAWVPLLFVWAFLAFGARRGLLYSTALLVSGTLIALLHVLGPPAGDNLAPEYAALAGLPVLGSAYLMLLYALTFAIERRTTAVAADEATARLLTRDHVTGLPNRAVLHERLETLTGQVGGAPCSLVLVDIDDFRTVNESIGIAAADDLLRAVGLRLATITGNPGHDLLAHLGADEFALVVPGDRDDDDARALAQRVQRAFQAPFATPTGPLLATASIGLSRYPRDAIGPNEQFAQAEAAVSAVKGAGGGGYRLAVHNAVEAVQSALARDLRQALGRDEFVLHYQPVVRRSEDGAAAVVGAEALLRWDHPERGIVPPLDFVPLAERSGLIVPIGTWVLREACGVAAAWQRTGRPWSVSVNVSLRQFTEPGLVTSVTSILQETGLEPARLVVEITETIADQPAVVSRLERLRELGVRVAIDDFGAGYSSLGRLRRLPLDVVKLDRSFVRELDGDDDRARLIVRAAVELARGLGAQVVAEGVERETQASALHEAGCRYQQGYLYGRPVEAAGFVDGEPQRDASASNRSMVRRTPSSSEVS